MDYAIFLTGLFLLAAGWCGLPLLRGRGESRNRLSAYSWVTALSALAFTTWLDILDFAYITNGSLQTLHSLALAVFTFAGLTFCCRPLLSANCRFPAKVRRTALAAAAILGTTSLLPLAAAPAWIAWPPVLLTATALGWSLPRPGQRSLFQRRPAHPAFTASLLLIPTALTLAHGLIPAAFDLEGLALSTQRLTQLALILLATTAALTLCILLWRSITRQNLAELSPDLARRRLRGTQVLLAASVFTLANGAWLAHWLATHAQKEQQTGILSALQLGADNLDPTRIESIRGETSEIQSSQYRELRHQLVRIRQALPGSRFVYLLGIRNDSLVFLADAENPASTETFSPPGEEVEGYPERWIQQLSGKSTFTGPERDRWGVWFSACIPIWTAQGTFTALLGADYPANIWLKPLASRRIAAMGVTLSISLLLLTLISFHLRSIESAHEVESQQRFAQQVMESVPNALAVIDPNGLISYANPAFSRLACIHPDQSLIGMPASKLLPSSHNGNPCDTDNESALLRPNGGTVPVHVFSAPLPNAAGPDKSILALVDLTSSKEAERALLRSRAEANRLALVAKRTDNAVVITDPLGRIEWVNEGFTKISGYSRDEVLGKTPGSLLQLPGKPEPARIHMRERIRSGQGFDTELLNYAKNGRAYHVHIECQPLNDKQGKLTGFMAIERDITQQRRTSRLLAAVSSVSTKLLSHRLDSSLWTEILAALGTAADADRCYYFQAGTDPTDGHATLSQRAEWNSGSSEPQIDNPDLQNLPFEESGFGRWLSELSAGREICGPVRNFPAVERPILEAQEILSLVVVPIHNGPHLAGFIGFDACREERVWQNWEVAILHSAAANIGLSMVAQNHNDDIIAARDEANSAALAADRANQAKSTFLATMSHEIRTPLNAVIGMASLLETTHLDAQQREYAETILRSSSFLLELINDILDYSRIESSGIDLDSIPFSIEDVCREAFEIVRPGAAGKRLELIGRIQPDLPPRLAGDPARIRQILVNLLGNAFKFTAGGHVQLDVSGQPNPDGLWNLRINVQDSGIGIAGDTIPRLFSPFVQEDSSTTRRFGGSGLGLAICRRLARAMGGDISVESTPGTGSIFTVELNLSEAGEPRNLPPPATLPSCPNGILLVEDNPANRTILEAILSSTGIPFHSATDAASAVRIFEKHGPFQLVVTDHYMPGMNGVDLAGLLATQHPDTRFVLLGSVNHLSPALRKRFHEIMPKPLWPSSIRAMLERQLPDPLSPPKPTLAAVREETDRRLATLAVLVAEDNSTNQKVILHLLRKLGIEPVLVANGKEAVDAVRDHDFDIAFLDVQMPLMDGLEACRHIHNLRPDRRPRLVALTANAFREDREAALAAGMDDYLTKPVTLQQLRERLLAAAPQTQEPAPLPGLDTSRELLNPEVLENLTDLGHSTFHELVDEITEAARFQFEAIAEAIRNGDAETFGRLVHRSSGGMLQFGFVALPGILRSLREFHGIPPRESAGIILTQLQIKLDETLVALAEWESTIPSLQATASPQDLVTSL